MSGYLRRNGYHLTAAAGLVVVQFLAGSLWALWYARVQRPRLLGMGAVPCASAQVAVPDEAPADCDLYVVSSDGPSLEETFYPADGSTRTVVRSARGQWQSTRVAFLANQASLVVPRVGLGLFLAGILPKMARTRSLFTWQLAKEPDNRPEELLTLYGVTLFVSGIASSYLGG
jgi:hypothetical protein